MKINLLRLLVGTALAGLAFSQASQANQVLWVQKELANVPFQSQLGTLAATNATSASWSRVVTQNFPALHVQTGSTPETYLDARVDLVQTGPESLEMTAKADISWIELPYYGLYANANAHLDAIFRIIDDKAGTLATESSKNVTLIVQGDVTDFEATLSDGLTTTTLSKGINQVTLAPERDYSIKVKAYAYSSVVVQRPGYVIDPPPPSAGRAQNLAKVKVIVTDDFNCDLTATPVYHNDQVNLQVASFVPEKATLRVWRIDQNGSSSRLVSKSIPANKLTESTIPTLTLTSGSIGLLSTLTVPGKGVVCSTLSNVDGNRPAGASTY